MNTTATAHVLDMVSTLARSNVARITTYSGDVLEQWLDGRDAPPARLNARQPVRQRHRSARVESWSPSSSWVPPWQDKATLCMCLCLSENTVDAWVRQDLLPLPRKRGGKLMWKWSEVEKRLEGDDTQSPEELAESIRNATRRAAKGE